MGTINPFRVAFLAAILAVMACSNMLPPLPQIDGESAPQDATGIPSAIYSESAGNPPFVLTVEATTSLTARIGPGESFQVVSPLNGEQPYFENGEKLYLVHDGDSPCQADDSGNLWVHVGSDRGIIGWAAGYYAGEFLLYPLPPDCST